MENLEGLLKQAPDLVMTYGLKILFALIIFFVGKYFSGVAQKLVDRKSVV